MEDLSSRSSSVSKLATCWFGGQGCSVRKWGDTVTALADHWSQWSLRIRSFAKLNRRKAMPDHIPTALGSVPVEALTDTLIATGQMLKLPIKRGMKNERVARYKNFAGNRDSLFTIIWCVFNKDLQLFPIKSAFSSPEMLLSVEAYVNRTNLFIELIRQN
jgi:hypothetical protein